jgi:endonuclease-3 related protein
MARVNTPSSSTVFLNIYNTLYRTFGPQHWWPGDSPFEIMVGAILAQNTNWRNASSAIERIRRARLLHPKKLLENRRRIPQLIKPSGFYRVKSQYLQHFLRYFMDTYGGSVKRMSAQKTGVLRKELLTIKGIGPETADSILLYALGKRIFVVDTYTRRILSRHHMIDTHDSYDRIQDTIQHNLPTRKRLFNEFHALLVRTGKEYCKKNDPLCSVCPLGTMLPRS